MLVHGWSNKIAEDQRLRPKHFIPFKALGVRIGAQLHLRDWVGNKPESGAALCGLFALHEMDEPLTVERLQTLYKYEESELKRNIGGFVTRGLLRESIDPDDRRKRVFEFTENPARFAEEVREDVQRLYKLAYGEDIVDWVDENRVEPYNLSTVIFYMLQSVYMHGARSHVAYNVDQSILRFAVGVLADSGKEINVDNIKALVPNVFEREVIKRTMARYLEGQLYEESIDVDDRRKRAYTVTDMGYFQGRYSEAESVQFLQRAVPNILPLLLERWPVYGAKLDWTEDVLNI